MLKRDTIIAVSRVIRRLTVGSDEDFCVNNLFMRQIGTICATLQRRAIFLVLLGGERILKEKLALCHRALG